MADMTVRERMPSHEEMVERARGIAARIRGGWADEAQELRRLPDEAFQEMIDAGFARLFVPRRFGGQEADFTTFVEMTREISEADASHGWVAGLMMHTPHYVAMFPEEAQEDVWANGPDVSVAGAFGPSCQVIEDGDGYRLTGKSAFASGIHGAHWGFCGGFLPGEGMRWGAFLIPRQELTLLDDWDTSGMRGTGSVTTVLDDVFVPKTHMMLQSDLAAGTTPGGVVNENPIFRAPWMTFAPLTFVTPVLGAAWGAYEILRSWTTQRRNMVGLPMGEIIAVQVQLARASAQLDAAELLIRRDAAAVGQEPQQEVKSRMLRDTGLIAELVVSAIDTIMKLSGAAVFRDGHPIERAWRDIHFASAHAVMNSEINYAYFGCEELGVEHPPGTII